MKWKYVLASFGVIFSVVPAMCAPRKYGFIQSTVGDWKQTNSFYVYDQGFTGGGSIAMADLGRDGTAEIITAAGLGGGPHISTFRLDGSFISQFYGYAQNMTAGVNVAAGDVDGDGLKLSLAPSGW